MTQVNEKSTFADWLLNYRDEDSPKIEGWVDNRLFPTLAALNEIQTEMQVSGGVMEIGVHHGRFFIALNGMVKAGEGTSFAVDIFEDQALNIDRSGRGSLERFRENLRLYDRNGGSNVECVQADSTRLIHQDLSRFVGSRPKIISIDGGHTVEHTLSDLSLATKIIHDAGAIFVDDILNPHWIGVFEGVVCFLQRRPDIWPVLVGFNKILLVPMSVHGKYMQALRERFKLAKVVSLCGYQMLSH
jgi:hypothetical protein